jgi:precorrin isomerase
VELCTKIDNRSTPGIDDTCVVAGNAPSEVVETSVLPYSFQQSRQSQAVELCTEVDNRSTPGLDETCVVAGNAPSEVVETSNYCRIEDMN